MSRFSDNVGRRTRNYMDGRNGADDLTGFTTLLSIVLLIIAMFVATLPLFVIAVALLIYGFYRVNSRNTQARRKENDAFVEAKQSFLSHFKTSKTMREQHRKYKDKYKFFKCKQCGHELMVPKGKGKIRVTCPHCGNKFEAKS